ncbi:MAG TPA: GDP-mannose 4,6-dehydratase, partial [Phycisphaerales bacterium]|nr:GDP-mannose 4,6-dehydratase [Phycisphaerales bacterium]
MAVSTRTLLVTGGAGFIGSNFCRLVLEQRKGWKVINYDALTYAGNLENLRDVEKNPNYSFVHGDIRNREAVEHALNKFKCDTIVHFAA